MNGKAVLPVAVAAELLSQAAVAVNSGLEFVGYNEMRLQKGVVLESDSQILHLYSEKAELQEDGTYKAIAELRTDGVKWQHVNAKAEIILAPKGFAIKVTEVQKVDISQKYNRSIKEAYSECLFHGEFLQALTEIKGWSNDGMVAVSKTSKPLADWFKEPMFTNWQSDPLMIDSAYQLMILWTTEALGAPSLPNYAKNYRQFIKSFDGQEVTISAKAAKKSTSSAIATIEFITNDGKVAAIIDGYECTINSALTNAFKKRVLGD